jgi:hypothetical protein
MISDQFLCHALTVEEAQVTVSIIIVTCVSLPLTPNNQLSRRFEAILLDRFVLLNDLMI